MKLYRDRVLYIINYYIKKYDLWNDFLFLDLAMWNKEIIRHVRYSDPIENLILGAINFQSRGIILGSPLHEYSNIMTKSDLLYEFFMFVYVFGIVLDKCNDENKQHLRKKFKEKCRTSTSLNYALRNFRAFYHEIKTLFLLGNDGFELKHLPEKESPSFGDSPPDAIFHGDGQDFQVECKSISIQSGHPIAPKSSDRFFNLLKDDTIYQELYPKDKNYCVEIIFDKKLASGDYRAEDLLKDLKSNFQIQVLKDDNVRILNDIESRQKRSMTWICNNSVKHQMILTSSVPNAYESELNKLIEEAIKKKEANKLNLPALYSIELYGPNHDNSYNNILYISNKIGFKNEDGNIIGYQHVQWDKHISESLIRSGVM